MIYYEISLSFLKIEPWKEIFVSLLADLGCESFTDGETEDILLAYISEDNYDKVELIDFFAKYRSQLDFQYTITKIEQQNWNAVWESNYEPVMIAGRCFIRAPFHQPNPEAEYEIVIEPKMSFGTAHHETTSLMIEFLLDEDFRHKSVLDMGAGTGILAILSCLKGAKPVTAIDNDEWAYKNNIENNSRNNAQEIQVKLGNASLLLENEKYDIIIANINRNILLQDLQAYVKVLNKNGIIFLSGFYTGEDLEMITQKCNELGLQRVSCKDRNNWCAVKFKEVTLQHTNY
ncbi:MAG: 50S ribosomal protein L11 methyltransferase [Bacteroidales bacterium]|jgi:ribosomal protein L11 methyltransferase|nr:50S ribosomal protein L11 methyltransferase [Bacteroidales bacterium]